MNVPVAGPVESPCIGVCQLNADRVCIGCGRTLDEIAEWLDADAARRSAIRDAAAGRISRIRPAFAAPADDDSDPR